MPQVICSTKQNSKTNKTMCLACDMTVKNLRHCTHIQLFNGSLDFVWDNLGELVPEETYTHSHLSRSSITPYLFPTSVTIHGTLSVQCACLTVTVFFLQSLSKFSLILTCTHAHTQPFYSPHEFCPGLQLSGGILAWLPGIRCRLAYSPADATATHYLLLQ